jgi:hypothetical protein
LSRSTFTEEAERHCKHAGEVLEEGLTVSGQGLVYNFDNAQYGTYKVGDPGHPSLRIAPNHIPMPSAATHLTRYAVVDAFNDCF